MMFVIALSFMIFAGCIFELMGLLIVSQVEMTMGGVDLYATSTASVSSYLNEGPITQFLKDQNSYDGGVVSYTYASTDLNDLLKVIAPNV
jgi:hypothetical protein